MAGVDQAARVAVRGGHHPAAEAAAGVALARVRFVGRGGGQNFLVRLGPAACEGGPAFLVRVLSSSARAMHSHQTCNSSLAMPCVQSQVYYSPAFLRKSSGHLLAALRVLASVYRAARSLFPLSESESSKGVIVYVDKLNAAGPADSLCSAASVGQLLWLLVKTGDCEAVVQRYSIFDHIGLKPPAEAHSVVNINPLLLSP